MGGSLLGWWHRVWSTSTAHRCMLSGELKITVRDVGIRPVCFTIHTTTPETHLTSQSYAVVGVEFGFCFPYVVNEKEVRKKK